MTASALPSDPRLVVSSSFPFASLVRLARAVIESRPVYAQQVTDGTQHVQEWLWAKEPAWRRVLLTPDGQMVGHVGVRATREISDLELVRLMVHPDWQRQGLAGELVDLAVAQFGTRLRALVGPDSPSHHMLKNHGWAEIGTAMEPGEPDPCVVMACAAPRPVSVR